MEFFFDEPVQPQQKTSRLFIAASRGDADRFTELLSSEDPSVVVNGLNCLHVASKKNHANVVDIIVRKDPSSIHVATAEDKTSLMLAAVEGNLEVIKVLNTASFSSPSDYINFQNDAGNSALHYCVYNGHEDCCKYLIEECKADPMLKNKDGMTAMQFAAAANHASLIDYLSSFGGSEAVASLSATGLNNLHRACMHGAFDTVVSLVSKLNMNPSAPALGTGNAAMHLAAKGGYNDIVLFLLDHPSTERDAQNKHGLTPLHFACNGGHYETTEMLIKAKCDTKLTTASGATALHLAAGSGNHELCELMASLEHSDVSIEDDDGQTAIDMALSSGYKELASKLAYWAIIASRSKAILLGASSHVTSI